ncbi:hypothetical protein HU200_027997 [Digitaria exilis]|uniref:DUF295 domain-containing protein n=1 Tax=Digitaria exilis TaxID=1010633 RepID=A0A835BVK6_9POAL|nr:hypothetical protein HU200_027997 [Digitaria exilis]
MTSTWSCTPAAARPSSASPGSGPSVTPSSSVATAPSTGAAPARPPPHAPVLPLPRRRRSPPTRTGAARSRPLYCRHGRALLHVADGGGCWHLVVWDAVTGYQQRLPEPGIPYWLEYSAVVFCAVACCDHLDCHGGPFPVAFIANNNATADPSEWSVTVSLDTDSGPYAIPSDADHVFFCYIPHVHQRRGAIVGDEIYFTLRQLNVITKYDWKGAGVIFVSTDAGLFTLALKTQRVTKVGERGDYFSVLPYMSFYTPDRCRLSSVARID